MNGGDAYQNTANMFSMSRRKRIDAGSRIPISSLLGFEEEEKLVRRRASEKARYVELFARTNFSFLQAGSSPEDIVRRAAELGQDAVGIVDRDGLYGIVRAHEEGTRANVRVVVGCELTMDCDEGTVSPGSVQATRKGRLGVDEPNSKATWTLLVHVETHAGYTHLCQILTESHARHPKGKARKNEEEDLPKNVHAGVLLETVCDHAEGLWCTALAGASHEALVRLKTAFGDRLSIGVHKHLDGNDAARLSAALLANQSLDIPIVLHNAVRFATAAHKPILDVLQCIREGTTLDAAGRALLPNAEARMKSSEEMLAAFPASLEWIDRAREIANACRFTMKELSYRFPSDDELLPGESADQALRRLTYEGSKTRYPNGLPSSVEAQIEKELAVILRLEVAPYFLSVRTIVEMARKRDILCQGRGSAANSAVCYCLAITAVDPARSSVLFERFLSEERREPPDIDVDFEHERREEVIQDIYARYGRDRAAMVSEIISYRGKSALKEVGKVFGFSLEQVDRLSELVSWWDGPESISPIRLREAGFDEHDVRVVMCLKMAHAIAGYPRHLSIHVGGFVLSATPLYEVAPVEPATMPGRTVVPWDKDDIDTLGFFKVDVLGLGMLSAIRRAMDFVAADGGLKAKTAIDRLAEIPAEDPLVYDALCEADTVGVFQIESRAQMSMLPRLRPRSFYDLVIQVAIVRPGPIQGGMVHPFLRRRNGEEPADPPHECLRPILDRTLGVPLFQEQVMQIAIVGAGYTGGEADQLRRDMAAWKKSGRLARHKDRLEGGFLARGISKEFSERLYKQIHGFGEYGFPESHAASFALLVYASSWLKVHHPAAFAAALVNSQPMGFYSVNTILEDARRHGVIVLPISIVESQWDCTLPRNQLSSVNVPVPEAEEREEPEDRARARIQAGGVTESTRSNTIRVGLRQIKGLGEESGRRIEEARKARVFESLEDLRSRAELSKLEMEALAESGALDPLVDPNRRRAIWAVREPSSGALFEGIARETPPVLPQLTRTEQLGLDFGRTGLSVSDHPMRALRPTLAPSILSSRDLESAPDGRWASAAGLVICRQRPGTASGVVFVTMEDEFGFINLVLWARVFERLRRVATSSSLLLAHGKVERAKVPLAPGKSAPQSTIYIIVERLEKLVRGDDAAGSVPSMSRDFH